MSLLVRSIRNVVRPASSLAAAVGQQRSAFSTGPALAEIDTAWRSDWVSATDTLRSDVTYEDSANQLRTLVKTGTRLFGTVDVNNEHLCGWC